MTRSPSEEARKLMTAASSSHRRPLEAVDRRGCDRDRHRVAGVRRARLAAGRRGHGRRVVIDGATSSTPTPFAPPDSSTRGSAGEPAVERSSAAVQALILVGGEGTRLRPLTSNLPKPVVPLAGEPFIAYMLQWLRSHGVDDVVLCLRLSRRRRARRARRRLRVRDPSALRRGAAGRSVPAARSSTPRTCWTSGSSCSTATF